MTYKDGAPLDRTNKILACIIALGFTHQAYVLNLSYSHCFVILAVATLRAFIFGCPDVGWRQSLTIHVPLFILNCFAVSMETWLIWFQLSFAIDKPTPARLDIMGASILAVSVLVD